MLSFNSFVSSSKSLNESLNKPVFFEYTDDTAPNKAFYIAFDIGNTKYGASLVETKYNKVYRLSVYRIVNAYRKLWSFKTATHVRPVLSTVISFLEKTVPYVYSRMDAMILDVTEKSDIAKYQSLFRRVIRMNPQLKKYDVAPVAKTSEKKNDNFMFVVKNGKEAGNIFTSAAFKKHYSFVTNQDGAVNVDILAAVEPKKVEKPIVSLEPSKKFLFDVLEVEYNITDPDIIANLEKAKSDYKPKKEKTNSNNVDISSLKEGDKFRFTYANNSPSASIVYTVFIKSDDGSTARIKNTFNNKYTINMKNVTLSSDFNDVIGFEIVDDNTVYETDFSKLELADEFQVYKGNKFDDRIFRVVSKYDNRYIEFVTTKYPDGKRWKIDVQDIKKTNGFEDVLGYKITDESKKTKKEFDDAFSSNVKNYKTDFAKLKVGDWFKLEFKDSTGTNTFEVKDRYGPYMDIVDVHDFDENMTIINVKDMEKNTDPYNFSLASGYTIAYSSKPVGPENDSNLQSDFSKLEVGDVFEFASEGATKTDSAKLKVVDKYGPYIILNSVDNGDIQDLKMDVTKISSTTRYKLISQNEKKEEPKQSSNDTKIFEDPNTRHDFNDIGVMFAAVFLHTISKNTNYHHIDQTIPKFDDAYTRFVDNRTKFEKDEGLNVMTYNDYIMETSIFNVSMKLEQRWKDFAAMLVNDKEKRDAFLDLIPSFSLSVLRSAVSIARASVEFISAEKIDLDIEPISEVNAFKTSNFGQPFAGDLGFSEDGPPPESVSGKVEYLTKQDKGLSEWYENSFDKHMYGDDQLLKDGVNALKDYTGSYAYDMNTELRQMLANFNSEKDVPDSMMGHTHSLMRYFDKAAPKLEKGIWVYRNVGVHPDPESLNIKDDYIDPAFQSCTISSRMSYGSGTMRLKIYLPAGTPCFPVLDSPKTNNPGEYEVVLPPLSVLSITKIFKRNRYGGIYYILECIYTGSAMSSFLDMFEKKQESKVEELEKESSKYPGFKLYTNGYRPYDFEVGDEYVVNGGLHNNKIAVVTEKHVYSMQVKLKDAPSNNTFGIDLDTSKPYSNIDMSNPFGQFPPFYVKKIGANFESQGFSKPVNFYFGSLNVGDSYVINGGPNNGKVATVIKKEGNLLGVSVDGYIDGNVVNFNASDPYQNINVNGENEPNWVKKTEKTDWSSEGFEKVQDFNPKSLKQGDQYVISKGTNKGKIVTIVKQKGGFASSPTEYFVKVEGSDEERFMNVKYASDHEDLGLVYPINWVKFASKNVETPTEENKPIGLNLSGKDYSQYGFSTNPKGYTHFEDMKPGDEYVVNGGDFDGWSITVLKNNTTAKKLTIEDHLGAIDSFFYWNSDTIFNEPYAGKMFPYWFKSANEKKLESTKNKMASGEIEFYKDGVSFAEMKTGDIYIVNGGSLNGRRMEVVYNFKDTSRLNVVDLTDSTEYDVYYSEPDNYLFDASINLAAGTDYPKEYLKSS